MKDNYELIIKHLTHIITINEAMLDTWKKQLEHFKELANEKK